MRQQAPPQKIPSALWVGPNDLDGTDLALTHHIFLPPDIKPGQRVAAVIMVHGWGGNESVMWIFARLVPPGVAIIAPRAPLNIEDNGAIWFNHKRPKGQPDWESTAQGVTALKKFVQTLPKHYPIDPTRIILVGFSQGAIVSNGLVITAPQIAIGVASLAGTVSALPPEAMNRSHLKDFPVFIAHGLNDETIPIAGGRYSKELYQQLQAEVTYQEYKVGHKMNSQGMKDLQQWLAKILAPPSK